MDYLNLVFMFLQQSSQNIHCCYFTPETKCEEALIIYKNFLLDDKILKISNLVGTNKQKNALSIISLCSG
jgi:hypothetical protein